MTNIYLYIKTHNKTGLKYLGKTIQDPFKYRGSGTRWLRHIKKHGNDVSTEILHETTDTDELKERGLHYSKLWDIVKSKEWANLKEETGDGGFDHINHLPPKERLNLIILKEKIASGEVTCGGRTPASFKKGDARVKEISDKANAALNKKRQDTEWFDAVKQKVSVSMTGNKNPSFGKRWVKNLTTKESKMVPKDMLNKWLDKGWMLGHF